MSMLWSCEEIYQLFDVTLSKGTEIKGVSIDTRSIEAGDLFVALSSARDGHDFVASAFEKGASAALVTHRPNGVAEDAALIIVPDVLEALNALASFARARFQGKVIGVTGSVGKTSTKEMLREILSCQGKTHVAHASFNNHWGVPLTLARMPRDADFAVIEIGMNAPGEIAPLSALARPDVALVTTVGAAHMEAFEDLSGIAHEKAAIFSGLSANGIAIYHADLEVSPILEAAFSGTKIAFGTGESANIRLSDLQIQENITKFSLAMDDATYPVELSALGAHFAHNALASLCVVKALDADVSRAARDLSNWQPPQGRGERQRICLDKSNPNQCFEIIDDAFNANPMSMRASLQMLAASRISGGQRIAILGDMLELGAEQERLHAELASDLSMQAIDKVHTVGSLMKHCHEALSPHQKGQHFAEALQAVEAVKSLVSPKDLVLIKGSKGSAVSKTVDALKKLGHLIHP